ERGGLGMSAGVISHTGDLGRAESQSVEVARDRGDRQSNPASELVRSAYSAPGQRTGLARGPPSSTAARPTCSVTPWRSISTTAGDAARRVTALQIHRTTFYYRLERL